MRKHIIVLAALASLAAPAFAGPCVALDYQEMKDMPVEDLTKEFCKASDALSVNTEDTMSNLRVSNGPKPFPNAQDNFDQCHGQMERIQRVLASKGMTKEAVDKVCMSQGADHKVVK